MGASRNMDGGKIPNTRVNQLRLDVSAKPKNHQLHCCPDSPLSPHAESTHQDGIPHMVASTSSPSLLTGCGDPTTPTGANIERHIHAHHVHPNSPALSPHPQESAAQKSFPTSPGISPITGDPPASLFLTPNPPRPRQERERPSSAPPHHLERISGTLLRLVGDHYLCCTCGRQLRTIGDQLTLETNLRHAISSGDLDSFQNG